MLNRRKTLQINDPKHLSAFNSYTGTEHMYHPDDPLSNNEQNRLHHPNYIVGLADSK